MKILLELRPAFDGHAGIPQEARLLFRGLATLPQVQVDGLLQRSTRSLAKGLPTDPAALARMPEHQRVNRLSRVVVSAHSGESGRLQRVVSLIGGAVGGASMLVKTLLGMRLPLSRFDPQRFEDFVWRELFAKTLAPKDFAAVTSAGYRVAQVSWLAAHSVALLTKRFGLAVYPRLDTGDYDLLIAETPYPGRVDPRRTRLLVRYHDAIPLLMPHTISDRAYHQASHYQALRRNVADGAWFACVSESSRRDLLSVFPEAEARAVTIPNMVSHRYFHEDSRPDRISDILATRANRKVQSLGGTARASSPANNLVIEGDDDEGYLLMVSTLEPRKNHLALLAAWEHLRAAGHPNLQLVLVGMLGWESKAIVAKLAPWVAQGLVHVLDDVPANELRLLYRHARVTVCPSFGEGFGYSGVEAMRCGGVVAASDLPVHREIYQDAAEYFSPYSAAELHAVLQGLLGAEGKTKCQALQAAGRIVAERYTPEEILPQWQRLLEQLVPARGVAADSTQTR